MKRFDLPASLVHSEGYPPHRAYGYRRQLDLKFGSQQAEDGTVPGVTQETQGHFLDLSSMAVNQTSIESDVVLMIGERHNRQQQILKTWRK